ncbi:hypothetical protein D1007_22033 [Hordeum vulgare]|nr:hypothetical protein D1007_22033 [Hordeum vulgare]
MDRLVPPPGEWGGGGGGRFWALAEDCSDGEGDAEDAQSPVTPVVVGSPTPSDQLRESLAVGYSEQEVAVLVDYVIDDTDSAREGLGNGEKYVTEVLRRVAFRRTSSSGLRP